MPYKTRKVNNRRCYRVYNPVNKKTFAKCTSKQKAVKQMRLLRAIQNSKKFRNNYRAKRGGKTMKKTQKYTRKIIRNNSQKKYKGGTKECCICDGKKPNVKNQILSPISCQKRIQRDAEPHIICGDCWWEEFANENNLHNCPGCAKEGPSPHPNKTHKPVVIIDLSNDSDDD
jgi:hypothetical protein